MWLEEPVLKMIRVLFCPAGNASLCRESVDLFFSPNPTADCQHHLI